MSFAQKLTGTEQNSAKKKGLRVKLKSGEYFVTEGGDTVHNDSPVTIYVRIVRKEYKLTENE